MPAEAYSRLTAIRSGSRDQLAEAGAAGEPLEGVADRRALGQLDLHRVAAGALAEDREEADRDGHRPMLDPGRAARPRPGRRPATALAVGISARQSAASIEVRTWEPWRGSGVATQPRSSQLEPTADRVGAVGRLLVVGAEPRGDAARGRLAAGQREQRGADEEQEGRHHRDRVAGQAEDEGAVAGPEPGRAARFQRHPPEDLLDAEVRERRLDVVVLADRDAAADDRHVGLERGASSAARVASGCRGPGGRDDLAAGEPGRAPGRCASWSRGSARGAAARRRGPARRRWSPRRRGAGGGRGPGRARSSPAPRARPAPARCPRAGRSRRRRCPHRRGARSRRARRRP